ncbi:DDB1- and CUL4-associated factor 1-like isoform X3 [Argiope bruennichi]|uniref:DDB1- and CUL4-associated factor 1-like isoform X3 n=1 Tax=Argiope bruennichi TaxID=94029 RepID=UPI00249582FB|nr:DDB1- and CUL4-associated factor 1-like isoform X3 [Argiope bruennichi]
MMSSVEEVKRLLTLWDEQNESGQDVTQTLMKLAEIIEKETEVFLKKDPDPFDNRHPSRLQPDCTLGHILKIFFRNERIVDEIVKVYCMRDVLELNIASCRLLLDIMPGLETLVFEEEGFVPRLLHWAEHAPNPLQAYATGLLAAAMDSQDIAGKFKDKNAYFVSLVPLMLRRLNNLSKQYLRSEKPDVDGHVPERPFAGLGGKSNNSVEDNLKNSTRKVKRRKIDMDALRYSPYPENNVKNQNSNSKISPVKTSILNDSSNSSWVELEQYVIGSYQVYPLNIAVEQRFILEYLTPMGEYQDLLGHIVEEKALPLILKYIDLHQNPDVRLAFEALKYLASLLCHKKVAIEFLNIGGLQLLLKVPYPSVAATGVSICLYYLAHIEEAMEKICFSLSSLIPDLVSYALWLLECSHDSSRCHASVFFGFGFQFRIILENFDQQDGLRKLFNAMSTLDIFVSENADELLDNDDQVFANRQTTRHVCGALKRYFEAHLVLEVDRQLSSGSKVDRAESEKKPYKAIDLSSETIERYMENWRELLAPNISWKPVDKLINLQGIKFLLDLVNSYANISYSGRADTVKGAIDVLKICSLTTSVQLLFCENVTSSSSMHITGVDILLMSACGEVMPVPDIQRCALHAIINCVCTKLPQQQEKNGPVDFRVDSSKSSSTPKKKLSRSIEECLNKLYKCIRTKNGILVLINLLSTKTPLTDADSIRALACQALCGLARSETVKQIISKLPLITDGQLLDLMKEPVLQDKGQYHVEFCKYGFQLIERVTGAPVSSGSGSSMLNINKSEIVAHTKIVYNKSQLLQLIAEHLQSMGFSETVNVLKREMSEKSYPISSSINALVTPGKNTAISTPVSRKFRNIEICNSPSSQNTPSVTSIPPPSVPLKIVVNKKIQTPEPKPPSSRLQKPQTCSGNYVQTPAMRRQGSAFPYGESQPSISLDSIVTEYLRKQHALCKNPMLACPPFDLFVPHKCPEPTHKRNADLNCLLRIQKKEIGFKNGGCGGAALDRKLMYGRFRSVRSFRDEEGSFCSSCFLNFSPDKPRPRILTGMGLNSTGAIMKVFNINSGEEEYKKDGSWNVSHIEAAKHDPLLITSDFERSSSSLWKLSESIDLVHCFDDLMFLEFAKTTSSRAVGTKYQSAVIIDTATCTQLDEFPNQGLGNGYNNNRATFDYSDELILSEGLIFDVRSKSIIHKLDKFNSTFNGVFHPNGREIVCNTEIWDIRTFKLLRTVVGLDQCRVIFNQPGTVIYGVYSAPEYDEKMNCFYTFDAYDYSPIATVNVKRQVFHLAVDGSERYISTIESQFQDYDQFFPAVPGVNSVCRLYEIGRTKESDEDGETDSEEETDEEDDDDDDDDEDDDRGENGQDDNDITIYSDDDSSGSSVETLFSLNTSLGD